MTDKSLVLDTNVIVSALLSDSGNPYTIWGKVLSGEYAILFSDGIIKEYVDVLSRPKLGISDLAANDLLAFINRHGVETFPQKSKRTFTDEDDRVFYDTARSASPILITGNKKHYPNDPNILTPAEFISQLS